MSQKTVLYDEHLKAGGKMVDFAGWLLPINYGSQIEEHNAVRQDAGIFDVSHMTVIDVEGPGAYDGLRKVLANDIAKCQQPGSALYSCLLNEEGGIIDDLIVYYFEKNHYRIISNSSTRDTVSAWLTLQLMRYECTLTMHDELALLAVQGPQAIERLEQVFTLHQYAVLRALKPFQMVAFSGMVVARTGYTGEHGVEIMIPRERAVALWADCLRAGIKPCGLGARDTLRLEAGLNLYGTDMNMDITPLESNLEWTVDLSDSARDFIGREALAQVSADHPILVGLVILEKGIPRTGQVVWGEEPLGEITSGTFSPTLARGIAMARITARNLKSVEVDIRGKRVAAAVVPLPFVRHNQVKISQYLKELAYE